MFKNMSQDLKQSFVLCQVDLSFKGLLNYDHFSWFDVHLNC